MSCLPLVAGCSVDHKYGQNSECLTAIVRILLGKHLISGHKCTYVGVFRGRREAKTRVLKIHFRCQSFIPHFLRWISSSSPLF